MRAMTADLDDQAAGEVGIDPSDGTGSTAKGLLQHRPGNARLANDAQEPTFQSAFTARVHQRVEQRSAAVDTTAMVADDSSAKALLGDQSQPDCRIDRVLCLGRVNPNSGDSTINRSAVRQRNPCTVTMSALPSGRLVEHTRPIGAESAMRTWHEEFGRGSDGNRPNRGAGPQRDRLRLRGHGDRQARRRPHARRSERIRPWRTSVARSD